MSRASWNWDTRRIGIVEHDLSVFCVSPGVGKRSPSVTIVSVRYLLRLERIASGMRGMIVVVSRSPVVVTVSSSAEPSSSVVVGSSRRVSIPLTVIVTSRIGLSPRGVQVVVTSTISFPPRFFFSFSTVV